jgi:hypothetical protein
VRNDAEAPITSNGFTAATETEATELPPISPEAHLGLYHLINACSEAQDFPYLEADELETKIAAWWLIFAPHGIPPQRYPALLQRASSNRVAAMARGQKPERLSAEFLVAQWLGPNGLQKALRDEKIKRGRTLTSHAQSTCPYCLGNSTGRRYLDPPAYTTLGPKCDHTGSKDASLEEGD